MAEGGGLTAADVEGPSAAVIAGNEIDSAGDRRRRRILDDLEPDGPRRGRRWANTSVTASGWIFVFTVGAYGMLAGIPTLWCTALNRTGKETLPQTSRG